MFNTNIDTSNAKELVKAKIHLDKLAQLPRPYSPNEISVSKKALFHKASRKYFTNGLVFQLKRANPKSPLAKSYLNTFYCQNLLKQEGEYLTSAYCKNRFCIPCNKIRTGTLINRYEPILNKLDAPIFLTLTRPNVKKSILRDEINYYIKTFQEIKREIKEKQGFTHIVGIRKLECTYTHKHPTKKQFDNTYHPHLHIVLSGGEFAAKLFIAEWLKRNPTATEEAQDFRPLGNSIELFKYFTKLVTKTTRLVRFKNQSKTITTHKLHPVALDHIFTCIKGLRIYQPFGIKAVDEDDFIIEKQAFVSLCDTAQGSDGQIQDEWMYSSYHNDWISTSTGMLLTDYKTTTRQDNLVNPHRELLQWDNTNPQVKLIPSESPGHIPPKIFKKKKHVKYDYV